MRRLLTGNEAVARGAYEAGITYAAAYPGTPSTEILENIAPYRKEIIAEWAPNEKVALESAIGASIAGARALAAMKHVGVNVAADPLFTFGYTGVNGGIVLITADDPGMHSSQNEQDNRYYAKFAKVAMLEPSNSQESKDMIKAAIEISEKYDTLVLFRMTTRICHSKTLVELGEREEIDKKSYVKNLQKYDAVPSVSRKLHVQLEKKLEKLEEFSNETEINYFEWNDKKIGIIASGIAYQYAKEVFGDKASYLKLGFTYPLPMKKIKEFADEVETLYVIEELEPFIEEQIKAAGIDCIGKEKVPRTGELNPDIIAKALLNEERPIIEYDKSIVADRPPTLCAGCPHRGFFYELAKRKNVMITGDIGCYGLGGMDPLNAKDTCICMGASISMGHGAQKVFNKFNEDMRVIAVIGDSTFFHTGINSLLDVVYNRSNTITCILDNRITGMTGHQENPGTGFTLQGMPTKIVDIPALVKAIGVEHIKVVNPLNLSEMKEAFDWALSLDEPSVIITRWPCVLKKHSQLDREEFGDYMGLCEVDEEKCIGCRICIKTGCPALQFNKEIKKVKIYKTQCIGCEVCLQVCPVKAISKVGE
ncbi:indolepyruvate ferredoxin oxidoreductase subunit alpha [Paramaledivibacter caminithermalis]|jgi:indolepyruvate ferredoxin oxidoreductase alpha subunit|uniref:Indolepyruvate oxidoreductase subunit IorA n=1 Tax=Paramaledivibacter caminithermalis (strain DSM 15212 / CIP 107654 / DViRD3) TaxID=1121301 RepID=A0A1M6RGI7_PARC5|nr:indolepyruvate ferredoxin oxidoreductase subunit alpha [Paramaledivibacter caminithermalis]SHK31477.1 indolepyruvate ferredoxin oxidoreductase alpha subunit [Paramaledivibacter caminithermalis DSM 15212]